MDQLRAAADGHVDGARFLHMGATVSVVFVSIRPEYIEGGLHIGGVALR